jgi:hypothetical protein
MTQDHEGQGVQTNGSDVRAVRYVPGRCATRPTDERHGCAQRVPPERAVKTPPHAFWHIGWNTPTTNTSTKPHHKIPPNGAQTGIPRIFWHSTLTQLIPPLAQLTDAAVKTFSLQPPHSSILTTIHLRRTTMKKPSTLTIILFASLAHAENYLPTDAYGNRKYDRTNYRTEGDKLIPTDSYGNRQFGKTNYKMDGDKLVPTDSFGNKKYDETAYRMKKEGHIEATDNFGNRKYGHEDFKVEGKKIVPVDSFGNRDYKRSGFLKQ